jgi:hypothetical protein
MVNIFGPEIHFAVSDRLNIGIMTTWIGSPLVAVGKFTIPTNNEKVNFSIGTMLGTSGYLNSFQGFGGLHWGTFTYGDRKNNVSFSAGFGYFNDGSGSREQYAVGEYVSTTGETATYTAYQYDESTGVSYTEQFEYFDYDSPAQPPTELVSNTLKAPIFSVAGIFQITSRVSIFFDSMFGINTSKFTASNRSGGIDVVYENEDNGYGYGNVVDVTSTPPTNSVTNSNQFAVYVMPGMRFQKNDNRAFQIAIAGVSVWQDGDTYTFPLPMVSWLFKF